jgi:uncharacterized protein with PIN domain
MGITQKIIMARISFTFHGYLKKLLHHDLRKPVSFDHVLERKASIKDVVESLGVPHPMVGMLTVNHQEVDFNYILQDGDTVEVAPLNPPLDPFKPTVLRPVPLTRLGFVTDVNVGRLALLLRLLGFDTVYKNNLRDRRLAEFALRENRILLSRDTTLLRRKIIMHGYLLQSQVPEEQAREVVELYGLADQVKPLSRCLPCNGRLIPIAKEKIIDRLEPLTRKYYDSFHICEDCANIYWAGSHQQQLVAAVDRILGK